MNRKDIKKQHIIQLLSLIASIILIGYISSFVFFRFDLTQEKRYTISPVTKDILRNLQSEVFVKVYLEGDIPSGFNKLRSSTIEMLDELRVYAGDNLQYQFIDPYESKDKKAIQGLIEELYNKGLQPTVAKIKDANGGYAERSIIPGALVSCDGVEVPVNLLSNNPGLSAQENLNRSEQTLEYNFVSSIKSLTDTVLRKVAFLQGHGELNQYEFGDIMRELSNFYQVDTGSLTGNVNTLNAYQCVIVAKPQKPFSEEDKFILDQYIMNGGRVLWLIDEVNVNADSLSAGKTFAFIQPLNLDDQLFKYGVRVNPVLAQDVQCSLIPVNVAVNASQPKFAPAPWLYYPLLSGSQLHPVSRNINMVRAQFANYIDTLGNSNDVKKQVLLATSRYSRVKNAPSIISLSEIREQHSRDDFKLSHLPVAVVLEGNFTSVFKNRMTDNLKVKGNFKYREQSENTRMIVIADGDIIRNDVRSTPQGIMISALGYDKYTSQTFGNKEFILNAVNYLTDDKGLMNLRTREITLRLLDKEKIMDSKTFWIVLNTLIPLLMIVVFAVGFELMRKRKYTI